MISTVTSKLGPESKASRVEAHVQDPFEGQKTFDWFFQKFVGTMKRKF